MGGELQRDYRDDWAPDDVEFLHGPHRDHVVLMAQEFVERAQETHGGELVRWRTEIRMGKPFLSTLERPWSDPEGAVAYVTAPPAPIRPDWWYGMVEVWCD